MRRALVAAVAIGIAAVSPTTGRSTAAVGDAQAARSIVVQYCVRRHRVPGFESFRDRAMTGAPAFDEFANHPGVYTEDRLRSFLRQPHFPMGGLILSRQDINGLIAFITNLRRH